MPLTPDLPSRPLRRALVVVATVAVGLGSVAVVRTPRPAAADEPTGDGREAAVASVAILVPDERLDPRIAALDLQGSGFRRAVDALDAALFAVAENQRSLRVARGRLAELEDEVARLAIDLRRVESRQQRIAADLIAVEAALAARAVGRFVGGGDTALDHTALDAVLDPALATAHQRAVELSTRADELQFASRADLLVRREDAATEAADLGARRREAGAELVSTAAVIRDREEAVPRLAAEVDAATASVRRARWSATIPGVDLSVVALDAYLEAEALLAEVWPSCGIDWWMIAGVARIESWHGRFGGRSLRADGRVDRPIIGIPLDGGPGVRAMPDSDGGRLDGDAVWDRAVGPLQFIPTTWEVRGRDGDGDGRADPQNIYDAAYSAGRYLCALGGELDSRSALRRAYFGYNNSTAYVDDVVSHADRYAAFALPEPAAVVGAVDNGA